MPEQPVELRGTNVILDVDVVSICHYSCHFVCYFPLVHNLILFLSKADAKVEARKNN